MKKIELEVIALSESSAAGNTFAIVLGEKNGNRRLPVIIGSFEAQAIAIELEKMKPVRPLTHDLFKTLSDAFSIRLEEVIIAELKEGIFFARLMCRSHDELREIDARTSDAIALALRFNCPVFTYEHILESGGVVMEQEGQITGMGISPAATEPVVAKSSWSGKSMEELEKLLDEALNNEDYEKAAKIRDEIDKRKSS